MNGKIRICRVSRNDGDDYISIHLQTVEGDVIVADMEMEPFAYALTGRADQPCEIKLKELINAQP